jgi:predicted AlkP superfamily pyrophosphatase or phosphodiesterase
MHIRRLFFIALLLVSLSGFAAGQTPAPPRLVVVITLDQFPYEYLVRFGPWFGSGGIRRLMTGGANFTHATYKHAITLTAPGHAVILSGTYGNQNGIVVNTWYDIAAHKSVYCVDDSSVAVLGAPGGGKSPANFIGSTYGDELRLTTGFRSKVIAISHKDRAAVLTGGKLANGVYWMTDSVYVSSTYYMNALPAWVRAFNASGAVNACFGRVWKMRVPPEALAGVDADDVPYEDGGNGMGRTFPHLITGDNRRAITPSFYHALLESPYGNGILASFAEAAVRGEQLGRRGVTDLLAVSFSSADYAGHAFGPHSREALDMAVATDSILADFLSFLDSEVGAGSYIVALTSDHGVAPIPEYILKHQPGMEAGRVPSDSISMRCEDALNARWGKPPSNLRWIEQMTDRNIYFRRSVLQEFHASLDEAARVAAAGLRGLRGIGAVYTRSEIETGASRSPLDEKTKRSYYPLRSGDLLFMLKPYFLQGNDHHGTSHGEPYEYCTHVPLIVMGRGITPGTYAFEVSPADLAPTLSALTGVEFTAQGEGRVLTEALR